MSKQAKNKKMCKLHMAGMQEFLAAFVHSSVCRTKTRKLYRPEIDVT